MMRDAISRDETRRGQRNGLHIAETPRSLRIAARNARTP